MEYIIKHITNETELDRALELERRVFGLAGKRDADKWLSRIADGGELMLFAESGGEVVAVVFGFIEDNGNVTVGPVATDEHFRSRGIAHALMLRLEEAAKLRGVHLLALGSIESAEGFYAKLGYTGSLLVQSERHSIDELLAYSGKYHVNYTNIWGGTLNQINLALDTPDRELQRRYERELGDCFTQMMFWKNI